MEIALSAETPRMQSNCFVKISEMVRAFDLVLREEKLERVMNGGEEKSLEFTKEDKN